MLVTILKTRRSLVVNFSPLSDLYLSKINVRGMFQKTDLGIKYHRGVMTRNLFCLLLQRFNMYSLMNIVEAPLRTIVENAGGEGSVVVAKVLEGKGNFGYDAKSETYVDLLKEGIIDPKKVTRIALENAASVAGMILTTECALVDIKEDAPPAMPPMGGGGMPGMM